MAINCFGRYIHSGVSDPWEAIRVKLHPVLCQLEIRDAVIFRQSANPVNRLRHQKRVRTFAKRDFKRAFDTACHCGVAALTAIHPMWLLQTETRSADCDRIITGTAAKIGLTTRVLLAETVEGLDRVIPCAAIGNAAGDMVVIVATRPRNRRRIQTRDGSGSFSGTAPG